MQIEQTPLHKAAVNGHVSVVEALLKAGATFGAVDQVFTLYTCDAGQSCCISVLIMCCAVLCFAVLCCVRLFIGVLFFMSRCKRPWMIMRVR